MAIRPKETAPVTKLLACALLVAVSAPAAAQIPISGAGSGNGAGLSRQLERAYRQIERARDADQLSRREARALRREANGIGDMAARYSRDGLSQSEAAELDFRASALSGAVAAERATPPEPGGRH